MPEPSAGSKLLAEEFGIEYDEGAEGIDEQPPVQNGDMDNEIAFQEPGPDVEASRGTDYESTPSSALDAPPDFDPSFGDEPPASPKRRRRPEQDPMVILSQDLEYTEKFLTQLRRLDVDNATAASHSNLEQLASDIIRRLNDTVRDREEQVRELLECEREFRKISGEMGGTEVLGRLDELEDLISETTQQDNATPTHTEPPSLPHQARLDAIAEESMSMNHSQLGNDWEVDPDRNRLGGEDEDEYEMDESMYAPSSAKADFPPPPPFTGPPTPANTIPQLAHLRTFTSSTASSLSTILEHTQVNTAATTEAGRKIRALKNKLGGWRTEWDSAERSRLRIEKWEAGIVDDGDVAQAGNADFASTPRSVRRIDGRKLVQEQLQAFEKILGEANLKTQSIMAAVAVS